MSKVRILELLPFFTLITIAAIISSATAATASFSFPDLSGKWWFGDTAAACQPGSTTTVTSAYVPLFSLAAPAGFSVPSFDGFSLFRSPVTSTQKYTRTLMTPDGPKTQVVEQSFDGMTGQRTRTVTYL